MTPDDATALLRLCGFPHLAVIDRRSLEGGMISRVEAWRTDGDPAIVVAKLHDDPADAALRREYATLRWMREHSAFPLPAPYGHCASMPASPFETASPHPACLLIEHIPGVLWHQARVSPAGREALQRQLAGFLVELHRQRGDAFGPVAGGMAPRWLDWFAPHLTYNYETAAPRLSPAARASIETLLAELATWLPADAPPTLVHSDLWGGNILVDDTHPDAPRITGFIDGGGFFADVEYELAYLLVFATADGACFTAYTREHPLREGFSRRCRVYWLNTMLLHLWMFGEKYLAECEGLAEEIQRGQ